jgi:error-prone DNA polymerase
VRLKTTVTLRAMRFSRTASGCCGPLSRIEALYPRPLTDATRDIAERCRFSLDELCYEYPEEIVPAGATATSHLRRLVEEGAVRRWPPGMPAPVRQLIERELALIAELGYERYFLTVHDIVEFARGRGILCQGRGSAANSAACYRARHHGGRSRAHVDAVRTLHLARAQRAARHRRGLRARAARGGDPVPLREVRPRARPRSPRP